MFLNCSKRRRGRERELVEHFQQENSPLAKEQWPHQRNETETSFFYDLILLNTPVLPVNSCHGSSGSLTENEKTVQNPVLLLHCKAVLLRY